MPSAWQPLGGLQSRQQPRASGLILHHGRKTGPAVSLGPAGSSPSVRLFCVCVRNEEPAPFCRSHAPNRIPAAVPIEKTIGATTTTLYSHCSVRCCAASPTEYDPNGKN